MSNTSPIAPELWVVDMDRTLLDTELTFGRFATACVDENITEPGALHTAKKKMQDEGGSFDALSHLRDTLGVSEDGIDDVINAFIKTSADTDMLYPDALPFLEELDERGIPNIIVTYGGAQWQNAKLDATGLSNRFHLVTGVKQKGRLIESWRTARGYVVDLAGELAVAHKVVLVDDKAVSFGDLPSNCEGYLVERSTQLLQSQQGDVPERVKRVSGLDEIFPCHYA